MHKSRIFHWMWALGFCLLALGACGPLPLQIKTASATPTIPELITRLSSADAQERKNAADQAYSYFEHPDKALLVPHLIEALSDPCPGVRMYAAQSIGGLGIYDSRAVAILTGWLEEDCHTYGEIIIAIQTLEVFASHASGAVPALVRVMMHPLDIGPDGTGASAARTLGAIQDPAAVPYLLSILLLDDQESRVRKSAALALASYEEKAACTVSDLVPLLDSSEPDVRIGAALVISQSTGNAFPGSERDNWDPKHLGSWTFEKGDDGEYLIVTAAKTWWNTDGQYRDWPVCETSLDLGAPRPVHMTCTPAPLTPNVECPRE